VTALQVARFVAILSLLCWAGTAAAVVMLALRRRSARAAQLLDALAGSALWLGFVVAAVCTAGSLYFSEVAHFEPCELCWYQRICMYPLAATLLIAAIRRDRGIWRYVVVPAAVGLAIAAYHTQLQAFPDQSSFCPTAVPCTIRYVWEFGFVSLPFMALAGFAFVLVMARIAALEPRGARP
jgi:disulfide bond formation protein DsbB